MKRETLMQDLNRIKVEKTRNARIRGMFCCPSTPAPTPPGSIVMTRNTGVGAGLLDSRSEVGAGVGGVRIKTKRNTVENPPVRSLTGPAGFSTPFPEGATLWVGYLSNLMTGGKP